MPFTKEPVKTPASLKSLLITAIRDTDPDGNPVYGGRFQVVIIMDDGSEVGRQGGLLQHLEGNEAQNIQTFLDDLFTRAELEIITGV